MDVHYFATPAELRAWLEANHDHATELWVGFHRKETGTPSVTWPEVVDEALCVGWIDGIRKRVDDRRFAIRLTPRKRGSVWSALNIANVERLAAQGRMRPAGIAAFERRDDARSLVYSYERATAALDPDHEARFRANAEAWAFWVRQPPGYRKLAAWYVLSARLHETRARRLDQLIADSAAGRRLAGLPPPTPKRSG